MYIPQDVVDLIIDQLALPTTVYRESALSWLKRRSYLKATSLVSTSWVNPSQRHFFSIVSLHSAASMQEWCSNIRPDPHGVSRHVRVLRLRPPSLVSDNLKTLLPHLTSFQNLQELEIGQAFSYQSYPDRRIDIDRVPLDLLVPIFSSFAGTLKRLKWTQRDTAHETWKTFYTLIDLLPNLMDIDLLGVDVDLPISPPALPRIYLSSVYQPPDPLAFKHFEFQELGIMDPIPLSPRFLEHCRTHLRVLDFWYNKPLGRADYTSPHPENAENLQVLFEACNALQEVSFSFGSYIGWLLGSIPSNSVTLIRLRHPEGTTTGATYNSCWGYSPYHFESFLNDLVRFRIPEYERLGVSIRKIARRFSECHRGLKTRVQLIYPPSKKEAQAIANGEIPFFMAKLEQELGTVATLELDLLSAVRD